MNNGDAPGFRPRSRRTAPTASLHDPRLERAAGVVDVAGGVPPEAVGRAGEDHRADRPGLCQPPRGPVRTSLPEPGPVASVRPMQEQHDRELLARAPARPARTQRCRRVRRARRSPRSAGGCRRARSADRTPRGRGVPDRQPAWARAAPFSDPACLVPRSWGHPAADARQRSVRSSARDPGVRGAAGSSQGSTTLASSRGRNELRQVAIDEQRLHLVADRVRATLVRDGGIGERQPRGATESRRQRVGRRSAVNQPHHAIWADLHDHPRRVRPQPAGGIAPRADCHHRAQLLGGHRDLGSLHHVPVIAGSRGGRPRSAAPRVALSRSVSRPSPRSARPWRRQSAA